MKHIRGWRSRIFLLVFIPFIVSLDLINWTVAINSRTDYWGKTLFGSPFNKDDDVLRVEVVPSQLDDEVEQFTIDFMEDADLAYLRLVWDRTEVKVPFKP